MHDAYWATGQRPAAEYQIQNNIPAENGFVPTNPAGIDLTRRNASLGRARPGKHPLSDDQLAVRVKFAGPLQPPKRTQSFGSNLKFRFDCRTVLNSVLTQLWCTCGTCGTFALAP